MVQLVSRRPSKQVVGQSLISPISAPPRARQSAWSPPVVSEVSPPGANSYEPLTKGHRKSPSADSSASSDSSESFPGSLPRGDSHIHHGGASTSSSFGFGYSSRQPSYKTPRICEELSPMDLPSDLIPRILAFVPTADLYRWMTASKLWSSAIFPLLYSHIHLRKTSGRALHGLRKLLRSGEQDRPIAISYASHIQTLSFDSIVFNEPQEDLLNWKDVKTLLLACGSSLESLSLDFDDNTFMNLPQEYEWMEKDLDFPHLTSLQITSRLSSVPEKMAIELLRKCAPQMLEHVSITSCLESFGGTSWYLLHDRISPHLKTLALTPSLKSKGGWDAELFEKGIHHIVKTSAFLKYVNLAGHRFGLADKTLVILIELAGDLTNVILPCGLNDTHLITLMSCSNLSRLKTVNLSCQCALGRFLEIKKDGWPCNKFTDSVLIALMEKFMADNKDIRRALILNKSGCQLVELVLPRYIMEVRTGYKLPTLQWATQFRGFMSDSRDRDAIFYKGFRLYSPGSRLIL